MSPSKPAVWLSSCRTVIAAAACSSASRRSGRYLRTGASSSTRPSSTSCITRVAVQTLVIDPIWNTESVVAATPVAVLSTPAAASTTSPPRPTATAAAGTSCSAISSGSRSVSQVPTSSSFVMRADARGAAATGVGRPDQAEGPPFVRSDEPPAPAGGQAPGMGRPLAIDDLADLQLPGEPTLSPDGRQIVYVLRTTDPTADADRRSLWSVRADGDGWGEPFRLTRGTADTAPAFSPRGDRLAFLRGGDGPAQLHLLPLGGGEAERVTDLPLGAGAPVWSPDGDRIAFTSPVRPGPAAEGPAAEHAPLVTSRLGYKVDGAGLLGTVRSHVHVLDVASGEVRQLTDGDWHAGPPAWSPDGTRLAFAAGPDPDADLTGRSAAHVVDAAGGEPRRIG